MAGGSTRSSCPWCPKCRTERALFQASAQTFGAGLAARTNTAGLRWPGPAPDPMAFRITLQCRCGPVARPLIPTSPSRCPLLTASPGCTSMRSRWQYMLIRPVAVIDEHGLAVEEIVIAGEHDTRRIGLDGRPARGSDVEAGMRRTWFAVEESGARRSVRSAVRRPAG
jgi:hypothetical protein